jgi:hypothetical protein
MPKSYDMGPTYDKLMQAGIIFLNSITKLMFVMKKCRAFFQIHSECLIFIWVIFGFNKLNTRQSAFYALGTGSQSAV